MGCVRPGVGDRKDDRVQGKEVKIGREFLKRRFVKGRSSYSGEKRTGKVGLGTVPDGRQGSQTQGKHSEGHRRLDDFLLLGLTAAYAAGAHSRED